MRDAQVAILVVDDNPQDRALVIRELRMVFPAAQIVEVADQRQLQVALGAQPFDVVITDYRLHWISGLEILRMAKRVMPNVPVIMFTATGSEEIAVAAMKSGLDDYIVKSLPHLVRLRGAVIRAVERRQQLVTAQRWQLELASLLDSLRIGVFSCAPDGQLQNVNRALCEIFQLDAQDFHHQYIPDLFVAADEYRQRMQAVLAAQRPDVAILPAHRSDGTSIWVEVTQMPHQSVTNEVSLHGLVNDITARRATEESLRTREAELAHVARLSTLGEMVAEITHEVNQPLHAIANFATGTMVSLQHDEPSRSELPATLERIRDLAGTAADVLRKYRNFARRQQDGPERIAVDEIVQQAVHIVAFEVRRHGIELDLHVDQPPAVVTVLPSQIAQVLVNLLLNACEAMLATETTQRRIVLAVKRLGQQAQISVKDRGAGLPGGDFERWLRPFETTKADGLGMGLAVSSRIVDWHQGKLWAVANDDGPGTTIYVLLPLSAGRD